MMAISVRGRSGRLAMGCNMREGTWQRHATSTSGQHMVTSMGTEFLHASWGEPMAQPLARTLQSGACRAQPLRLCRFERSDAPALMAPPGSVSHPDGSSGAILSACHGA